MNGGRELDAAPDIVAAPPADFSDAERAPFRALVRAGGEVGGPALETNITTAKALVMLGQEGELLGVAALKRPQASYRKRIAAKANADLAGSSFPYELGYIFIVPEAQGRKLSHRLVAAALEQADGAGVFATARTDNAAMLATLAKAGFETAGEAYRGRGNRMIRLLVRQGT